MKVLLALGLIVMALAACGGSEAPSGDDVAETTAAPTIDGDWELTQGIPLVDGYPITLSISGDQVSGRAACNSYGGSVAVADSTISFGEIGRTEMGCEPDVMEAETGFLAALTTMDSFVVTTDRLTLSGSFGDLVFVPLTPVPTADLIGSEWVLETIVKGGTASSVAGEPATLSFADDGTLSGSTGCRALRGSWIDHGGAITLPELSADGECSAELTTQDSDVISVLDGDIRIDITGDKLTLTSMGNEQLVYRAEG
jgi:heat shock protein HslJ